MGIKKGPQTSSRGLRPRLSEYQAIIQRREVLRLFLPLFLCLREPDLRLREPDLRLREPDLRLREPDLRDFREYLREPRLDLRLNRRRLDERFLYRMSGASPTVVSLWPSSTAIVPR